MSTYSLPWLCLHTDLLENPKTILLNRVQRWHFVELLIIKRRGLLNRHYRNVLEIDGVVARLMYIGKKACANLKTRLIEAQLIDENWQPLGWYERQKYAAKWERLLAKRMQAEEQSCEAELGGLPDDQGSDSDSAKRVRKHRQQKQAQRQTAKQAAGGDATPDVTQQALHATPDVTQQALHVTPDVTQQALHVTPDVTQEALHVTPDVTHGALHSAPTSKKTSTKTTTYNTPLNIDKRLKIKDIKEREERESGGRAQARVAPPATTATTATTCATADADAPVAAQPLPPPPSLHPEPLPAEQTPQTAKTAAYQVVRGARLAPDWRLPREWGEWALREKPHWTVERVRHEAENFADYWHAKAGKDACKCDWPATWRKWIRGSEKFERNAPKQVGEKLRPLSFAEGDLLRKMQLSVEMGLNPGPGYEELKRRASVGSGMGNGDFVIDVTGQFQNEGLRHVGI